MQGVDSGWGWFDANSKEDKGGIIISGVDPDLLNAYVRTFQNNNGKYVLSHLRNITSNRVLGPNASDSILRHLEGQRQLVQYIISLVERGSNRIVGLELNVGNSNQRGMEIENG